MVECTARLRPGFESRPGRMMKEYVSFEEFKSSCKSLAGQVKKDRFKPDFIIGIAKGGWVPARFMGDYLGVDCVASIGCSSYHGQSKTKKPEITEKLGLDIKGLEVLVVDDIADSGESLEAAKQYLLALNPKKLKFATLHYKQHSKFKPDYYAEETSAWIVYPWEMAEDARSA